MGDSMFNIFGDHIMKSTMKNISRQPLCNVENMGKKMYATPIKPNEPMKKAETKKSFLSNKGMSFQSTPARKAFTPRAVNVGSLIYSEPIPKQPEVYILEDIEFTKPTYLYDNYHKDVFDFLPLPELQPLQETTPRTPPPKIDRPIMDYICSDEDYFTDDFSNESFKMDDDDIGLPNIF